MHRWLKPVLLTVVTAAVGWARPAAAMMDYVYDSPESPLDHRYEYHWEILRTALERTKATWGPYHMRPSTPMTENRQAYELKQATGKLTVMYLGTTPDFERHLVPIRIPVDKDLGGYNVFLIKQADRDRFTGISQLAQLRRFTFGLGQGWIDVGILRHAGFNVVTGSNYDGLFEMLEHRRFDIFLRAATEVLDEYEQRRKAFPDLHIEERLGLFYPLPMYFWFSETPEGHRLAERAEAGMRMMIADGTYDRIFDRYQRARILRLDLKHRHIFRIDNPFLGPETPLGDKRLWFDPQTYR